MKKTIKIDDEKRYERQSEIFNGEGLTVAIVGVGAVGRQVALQLCAMGAERLVLIDYDKVEDVNLSAQGFRERDLGKPKVKATQRACWELNSSIDIPVHNDIYCKDYTKDADFICCCVDNMGTRKQIVEESKSKTPVFDSRMAAQVCRILTVDTIDSFDHYIDELFTDDEMIEERCTARTTLFCANICAGMLVSQLVKKHAGKAIKHDICYNIQMETLFVRAEADKKKDDNPYTMYDVKTVGTVPTIKDTTGFVTF
jgi:sulfur carrier protein ThiS adenylyltransferase